jgi:hypothetical protein
MGSTILVGQRLVRGKTDTTAETAADLIIKISCVKEVAIRPTIFTSLVIVRNAAVNYLFNMFAALRVA